uniref:Uncharacterized protein n=1 Tax=Micromonas pusilla TaxID=38833 RepID=A0A6U0FDC8_MICPS|mmetsp:Transcript_11983/g.43168  ORF Transcript_11983/g.43168 Transcript_11983/m.43168 type:complete len:101 (+) Transcript_11983:238-540(+)|eukprot:31347-Pelagococcus_subviridis.AAC.13
MNCPEEVSFNVKDGFLDAALRGFRRGLISAQEYRNLGQCDSLDDLKLQLCNTDFESEFLNETASLHTSTFFANCSNKLVDDFNRIRYQVGLEASFKRTNL